METRFVEVSDLIRYSIITYFAVYNIPNIRHRFKMKLSLTLQSVIWGNITVKQVFSNINRYRNGKGKREQLLKKIYFP